MDRAAFQAGQTRYNPLLRPAARAAPGGLAAAARLAARARVVILTGPAEEAAAGKEDSEGTAGAAAAKSGPGDADSLLPPGGFLGTWKEEGKPEIFESAGLYGHIDGGAEVYLELGFDRLTVQRYLSGAAEIVVEIYRMSDPVAALGIYLMQCGRESPDETVGARNTKNPFQLLFVKGAVYATVTNADGSAEGAKALAPFGRYVAARLPAGDAGDPFAALPAAGRIAGSERVIRGPFTLQAVYTLGEGDILELEARGGRPGVTAAAADYEGEKGEVFTRIAAVYPDSGRAGAVFEKMPSRLDTRISVLSRNDTRLVFRDFAGRFGTVVLEERKPRIKRKSTSGTPVFLKNFSPTTPRSKIKLTKMKKTVKITKEELIEMLRNWNWGAQPAAIQYLTHPKLTKEGKVKFGEILKIANINAFIGYKYENSVNKQREREQEIADFLSKPLWNGKGKRLSTALSMHVEKGTYYLTYKFERSLRAFHFDGALNFIPAALLKPFFPKSNPAKYQGVKKAIQHREINIDNVRKIKVRKTTYEIVPD